MANRMSRSLTQLLLAQAAVSLTTVAWALFGSPVDFSPYEPLLLMLPVIFAAAFALHVPFSLPVFRVFCGVLAFAGAPLALLLLWRGREHLVSLSVVLLVAQVLVAILLLFALPPRDKHHLHQH